MLTNKTLLENAMNSVLYLMSCVGERCTLQAAPWVEVVFERPQEVQECSKKVRAGTAKFVRWTGAGHSVYRYNVSRLLVG